MSESLRGALLAVIVAAYMLIGALYAVRTPIWETPDEPAHFNYVRHLAERLEFPELKVGDYDQVYLEELKASKFAPGKSIDSVRYESWQPPLYYLLSVPFYWAGRMLTQAQLVVVLRLLSVLMGGAVLLVSYRIARRVWSKDDLLVLAVPGFIATLPQHLAITASVSNDTLAELILSLILLVLVKRIIRPPLAPEPISDRTYAVGCDCEATAEESVAAGDPQAHRPPQADSLRLRVTARTSRTGHDSVSSVSEQTHGDPKPLPLVEGEGMNWRPSRQTLTLGALLGMALLTKSTIYVAVVLIPLGLLLQEYGRRGQHPAEKALRIVGVVRQSALAYAIALALSGWWFVRNAWVYGGLDLFAWRRHELVVQGQPLVGIFDLGYAKFLILTAFKSFWAQFGWMGVLADERTYLLLGVLTTAVLGGLLLFLLRIARHRQSLSPAQLSCLLLMGATFVLVLGVLVFYNFRFIQAQGRYLFPALVPIAFFFALGLREIVAPRYAFLVFALLYLALLTLDYISLTRFILPQLAG